MQTAKITAFVFGLALVSSACGDSMSALNPTAPSSLSPDSVKIEAGADGVAGAMGNGPKPGNGKGNGNGNGNGNSQTPSLTTGPVETRVQLQGTVDAKGDSSITVNNQVVKVTSQTVIRKGDLRYEFSGLRTGDQVHVDAMRSDNNGVVSVEAKEIKLQNPGEGGEVPPPPPPPLAGSLSVAAVDGAAEEGPSNTGLFRITRSGDADLLKLPLELSLSFAGNATHGSDYNAPLSVKFEANALSADVLVTALADTFTEGTEEVMLTLSAVAPYTVGANGSAKVNIADPPAPPAPVVAVVSVRAQETTISHSHPDGIVFGVYEFTRTGDMSSAFTLNISVSGSAGHAYAGELLGSPVSFGPNQATASFFFMTFEGLATGTVVVTVNDTAAYNPGQSASATVTINP